MLELGEKLKERRQKLKLSQPELADLAEVSERLVRDIEKGRTTVQVDKLLAVVEALGLEATLKLRKVE